MLNDLSATLAELYGNGDTPRRIAEEIGLRVALIDFRGPARDVWARVVGHADRSNKLPDLVAKAHSDYPENERLNQIYGALIYQRPTSRTTDVGVMSNDDNREVLERVGRIETALWAIKDNLATLNADVNYLKQHLSVGTGDASLRIILAGGIVAFIFAVVFTYLLARGVL